MNELNQTVIEDQEPNEISEPGRSKSRRSLIAVWALILVAAGFGAFKALGHKAASKEAESAKPAAAPPAPSEAIEASADQMKQVSVEPVGERAVPVERETTGKVGYNEDRLTPVFAPYSGRAVEVLVNKGETVRAGQPLLALESPDYVAAQNDLVAARADVAKAKINLESAQKAADRAARLNEREALATKDLEQARADLRRSEDELRRAQAAQTTVESRLALFGKTAEEVSKLGGQIDRRIVIRAPLAGTVVERKVGPGQYVRADAADPLYLISDLSTVWVQADVHEGYLSKIRVGLPVQVSVAAYPERTFSARIALINPTVDPVSRMVRVRCVAANAGGLLKPEMFARIRIGAAGMQPATVVPSSAVLAQPDGPVVLVEETPRRYRPRQVRTGRGLDGLTVIEAGLKPGDRVVTHGAMLLSNQAEGK